MPEIHELLEGRECTPALDCHTFEWDTAVARTLCSSAVHHNCVNKQAGCRDDKPSDEGTPWGEQEQLEQEMLKRAGAAQAAPAQHPDAPPQYDFVEDDHIDFVVMETIKGSLDHESSRCANWGLLFQ